MRLNPAEGAVGCLLMGDSSSGRLGRLRERLSVHGVETVEAICREDRLCAAQEGLYAARRRGGTCVAAEGEWWTVALALAVQLNVDRVALILPAWCSGEQAARQQLQMRGFVRRNLFFCVSDVLVLESGLDGRMAREIDGVCRRMYNARVWRMRASELEWQRGGAPLEAAARFLAAGEYGLKTEDSK